MDLKIENNSITFEKELSDLDIFTFDFVSILERLSIKYVVISGYVAIIFGRNRSSEDIDIFIEKLNYDKFEKLWKELLKDFECLNTLDLKEAFKEYLQTNHAIRFSKKNEFLPNMELKFAKTNLDFFSLKNRFKVICNDKTIYLSPFEIQIAYKLYLGSKKDIEDARFLYKLFEKNLNPALLENFFKELKISKEMRGYLK